MKDLYENGVRLARPDPKGSWQEHPLRWVPALKGPDGGVGAAGVPFSSSDVSARRSAMEDCSRMADVRRLRSVEPVKDWLTHHEWVMPQTTCHWPWHLRLPEVTAATRMALERPADAAQR